MKKQSLFGVLFDTYNRYAQQVLITNIISLLFGNYKNYAQHVLIQIIGFMNLII